MLLETNVHNVHTSFNESLHNEHERFVKLLMNVKSLYFESIDGTIPKDNYFKFCDFLTQTFGVWTPGKLIQQYGYVNILKASEIALEEKYYRDKSRKPVGNIGGFFTGVLKNISGKNNF